MNAVELYLLGRRLMKIAEEALPKPASGGVPTSVRMVLLDIGEHPDSSVGEIASRTGFPQSHVSASIVRLREFGALETSIDPHDRRRTLTRVAPRIAQRSQRAAVPVDSVLAMALHSSNPTDVKEVIEALDELTARLMPADDHHHPQAAGTRR
jgi:DNA-binding MarR family transcriptional regulator